jgi:hypothetical protein
MTYMEAQASFQAPTKRICEEFHRQGELQSPARG